MPVNITNGSLTAAAARKPNVPALPATPSYYTTIGQARTALNGVGPDEPGTGVRFAAGKGYYLGAAAKQAAAPSATPASSLAQAAGPFAPFQQTVSGYVNQLPAPLTDQQISQRAQAELSPLVKALTTNVNTRTQAGDNAITGYTKDAIAKLAGLNWTAPYQGAEQQQASADAALQQSLNGQGTSDAQGLASRLAVLGDPSVTQAANNVAGNGAANGTTQVAQGTSALSNLIAQAAAAGSYGEKQPGIARTAGLQDLATNEQNANNNIATQTQALQAQLPQILSDLRSQSDSRAQNRASLGEDLTKYLTSRSDAINAGNAANQTKVATATIAANQREYVASQKAAATGAAASAKAAAPSASLTRANGYLTSNNGQPIRDGQGGLRPIAGYRLNPAGTGVVSTKTAAGPQLSAVQVQKYKGTAATIAENAYKGFTPAATKADPTPKPIPPIGYQEALDEMRKEGIPDRISIPKLNQWYSTAGARGRPYTKAQQAANQQAQAGLHGAGWPYQTVPGA